MWGHPKQLSDVEDNATPVCGNESFLIPSTSFLQPCCLWRCCCQLGKASRSLFHHGFLWSQHLIFHPFFEQHPCEFLSFHWQQRLWLSILFLLWFLCRLLLSVDVTTVTTCHAKLLSHLTLSPGMEMSGTFETVTPCFLPGR